MSERNYVILVSLFCVVLILTNLIGLKIFQVPFSEIALTSGIILYPWTFILSDIVTEVYGKQRANFMVYLGFAFSLFTYGMLQLILFLPPHPYWAVPHNSFGFVEAKEYQNAFLATFSINGLLIFSSMLAFLSAQLLDVSLFQKIKEMTKGKHLWLRNNVSTILSQGLDTLIVSTFVLFLGLHMEFARGMEIMLGTYLAKILLTIISTPLIYLLRRTLVDPSRGI